MSHGTHAWHQTEATHTTVSPCLQQPAPPHHPKPVHLADLRPLTKGRLLSRGSLSRETGLSFQQFLWKVPTKACPSPSGCHTHLMVVKVLYHPPLLLAETEHRADNNLSCVSCVGQWSGLELKQRHTKRAEPTSGKVPKARPGTRKTLQLYQVCCCQSQETGPRGVILQLCFTSVSHICNIKKAHINC